MLLRNNLLSENHRACGNQYHSNHDVDDTHHDKNHYCIQLTCDKNISLLEIVAVQTDRIEDTHALSMTKSFSVQHSLAHLFTPLNRVFS